MAEMEKRKNSVIFQKEIVTDGPDAYAAAKLEFRIAFPPFFGRGGGLRRPGKVSTDEHAQRGPVRGPPAAAVNVGQTDPFGPVWAVIPANQRIHAAAGEASGGFVV